MPADKASANALIVAQMRPALVRYFRRKCGVLAEAEDLTQDVLLRVLGKATWATPEQAKAYIFRSAVNCWRDRGRKMRTHGVTVEWDEGAARNVDEAFSNHEETSPEHVLVVQQELKRIVKALGLLNERTRDIFLLIRLEQMKHAAVAEALGISVSTVEKELAKALAHLARSAKV